MRQGKQSKLGWRFNIRHKLFLVSLCLLIIPWLGYRYVIDMNSYLLKNQEQALLDRARVVAAVLYERAELFQVGVSAERSKVLATQHLYVRALQTPIRIDGYADDWLAYDNRQQHLDHSAIIKHEGTSTPSISARYQLGSYEDHLYLLFRVVDDVIVYSQADLPPRISDHMQIAITTPQGTVRHFLIATFAPGRVNVQPLQADGRFDNTRSATPIEAEWQEVGDGYNIELRIPLSELGDRIGFTFADVDNANTPRITTLIGTLNHAHRAALGSLVVPSPEVEALLDRLETPSSRTWIVDQTQRVIARTGQLNHLTTHTPSHTDDESVIKIALTRITLNLLLSQPTVDFEDDLSAASRLGGETIDSALRGIPAARWRHTPDHRISILTVTQPVFNAQNEIIGAVAIEETSNTSLMVQNRAMEIVINLSVMTFLIATVLLLSFAARLTSRIRRLRNDADAAIAPDGRIRGEIKPTRANDEIGDLSRSFSGMIHRLTHYNRYLEAMASKLSHELRTPIAVLRSSLENLETETYSQQNATYLERARDGITRLDLIVTRMSEATRLEQTLQSENKQPINLNLVISSCVTGYCQAFSETIFQLKTDNEGIFVDGAADLIAQLLDKLINNARDFAIAGTPIVISLSNNETYATLSVRNQGPHLPNQMQASLFNSMISIRNKRGKEPHLGLGLYIVRLIVEFHQGEILAKNTSNPQGVEFTIKLPLTHRSTTNSSL